MNLGDIRRGCALRRPSRGDRSAVGARAGCGDSAPRGISVDIANELARRLARRWRS
jgi:hypothetical protein